MVDIRPILIRHPEPAIRSERKAFAIHGNALPARAGTAKTITLICSDGQDGETGVCDRTKSVGVKPSRWGPIRTGEENGVFVRELEVRSRWISERSVRLGCQSNAEFMDTVLVVESSLGVPASLVSTFMYLEPTSPAMYQPLSGRTHSTPV